MIPIFIHFAYEFNFNKLIYSNTQVMGPLKLAMAALTYGMQESCTRPMLYSATVLQFYCA